MMRRALAAMVLAALLGGCGGRDWHGEAFSRHYPSPNTETSESLVERVEIMHWTDDPRQKEKIGLLETYTVRLAGSRRPHDIHYIKNAAGTKSLGYINENGVFFRYTRDGQAEKVGEYPIRQTGIRIFFGYSKEHNIGFEEINPYAE